MPLHPLAQAFIDLKGPDDRPVNMVTVEEARRGFAEMAAAMPPGEPVGKVEDMLVPVPGDDIPVRVYTPVGEGPFPVLVNYHGGGWVVGGLDADDFDCRAITNAARCIVVSVGYRLAPESKFPIPVDDAYLAARWAADNSASLGGDGAPIAVGGTSAGGNLAAVVALMARDKGGPPIACQVLRVPVTDCSFDTQSYLENGEDYVLTKAEMQCFWDYYLSNPEDGAHPYASPLRAPDLSGLPPALVQTAQYDPLRDEGRAYADRLREAGVPVTFRCYEGMIHMVLGPEAAADEAAFLREHLGGQENPAR